MTLRVTITVDPGQAYKACVVTMAVPPDGGPFQPRLSETQTVEPGEKRDFYIHRSAVLHVHEQPLHGA